MQPKILSAGPFDLMWLNTLLHMIQDQSGDHATLRTDREIWSAFRHLVKVTDERLNSFSDPDIGQYDIGYDLFVLLSSET